MVTKNTEAIIKLLEDTEAAHHAFEFALGKKNSDWATWYAQYMLEHGLDTHLTVQALASLLLLAADKYQPDQHQSRNAYIAEFLSDAI